VYAASQRWMKAGEESPAVPGGKVTAVTAHLGRLRELSRIWAERTHFSPASSGYEQAQLRAYVAEAQLWLAQAQSTPAQKESGPGDGRGKDPRSRRILARLDEPIAMNFAKETPLDDVLQYIRTSTQSAEMPSGLAIYVDPLGLQEAERSLNSTVTI